MPSELEKGIYRYVDYAVDNASSTHIYTGLIKSSGADGYTISLNGVEYANVPSKGTFLTNDTVRVVVPNNQYSNMFILSDSTGGSGTSAVSSVNGMTGDVVISNVASADKLSSAKTITLSGDATGFVSTDFSTNPTVSVTVVDDSHNHIISNVDGLQTALDGKSPIASPTFTGVVTSPRFASTIATGTAPLTVASTTLVTNLNADLLDGLSSASTNTVSTIVARDSNGNFSAGTITANLTGNSSTSTKLATARNISLSGDVTGSVSFDGSGNSNIVTTVVDDSHNHIISNVDNLQTTLNIKADLVDGKVPSSQLPSFVDDVLEYATLSAFPVTGTSGIIYVDLSTNLAYRWSGTVYVEISPSLALGETSSTAYRGDRGAIAYNHSLSTSNPHTTTASQVGLGNVPNVTTNNQTPTFTMAGTDSNLVSGETLTISLGKISKAVNSLISHISDSIKHITSTERTNWNTAYTNNHTHSNKTILDNTTASYTTAEQTKLSGTETGAEVNNISDVNATDLTDGGDTTLHHHATDRNRANHTGTQLASTISDFASTVRSTVLTGLSTATNAIISATDTVLSALGKLQAQITANLSTLTTHTGNISNPHSVTKTQVGLSNIPNAVDSTIGGTSGSTSLITSGAVNSIEIGGRNLAVNTMIGYDSPGFINNTTNYAYALADDTAPSKFYAKWDIPAVSTNRGIYYIFDKTIKSLSRLTTGDYYTVSFYAKASVAGNVFIPGSIIEYQTLISNSNMILTTEWKKYYVVCKFITTTSFTTCFYVDGVNAQAATIYMSSLKIERGQKATDWTPSPEDNLGIIASKTYTGIIATVNDFARSAFYFATIRPTTWYKVWRIKYRIQATSGTDNNYAGASIVEMYGCQANRLTYSNFNNHYNASSRSYYYHDLYSLTSTGYTNGYGHAVGVELTNSANSTNATYARTFIVDILETENCDVTMLDNMTLYASLSGTGATNYNGYGQYDGQNNGLRESGDDNNIDRMIMPENRVYAGTNGMYGSQLIMQLPSGKWESLTLSYTTATNKTRNTTGFLLPKIMYYSSGNLVTSGNLNETWTNYEAINYVTFQYSSNCGTTLVAFKSLYLVGTISNGLFYLDDVWWSQTLPTSDDGKVYVYIGETTSTSQFSFYPTHPIYAHVNGYLRNITDYSLMSTGTTSSIVWN